MGVRASLFWTKVAYSCGWLDFLLLNLRMCILTYALSQQCWVQADLVPLGQNLFLKKWNKNSAWVHWSSGKRRKRGQARQASIFSQLLN